MLHEVSSVSNLDAEFQVDESFQHSSITPAKPESPIGCYFRSKLDAIALRVVTVFDRTIYTVSKTLTACPSFSQTLHLYNFATSRVPLNSIKHRAKRCFVPTPKVVCAVRCTSW